MLKKTLSLCFVVCCLAAPLVGQQSEAEYLLEASSPVEEHRFKDIRGTPYRYGTFRPAVLYDATLNKYPLDSVNYNGFTSRFEYIVDGEKRELAGQVFLRGNISDDDGAEHVYGWRINPKFPMKYAEILFRGDFVTATMIYDVINDTKVVQDVGKTEELERFSAKSLHFALVDGDLITLKTSTKALAEDLGFKSQLTKFIKANKLKPNRREDLIKILARAEELFQES